MPATFQVVRSADAINSPSSVNYVTGLTIASVNDAVNACYDQDQIVVLDGSSIKLRVVVRKTGTTTEFKFL
jgi:hypothetical protein